MSIFAISVIALALAWAGMRAVMSGTERAVLVVLTVPAALILAIQGFAGLVTLTAGWNPEHWHLNWSSIASGAWALLNVGVGRWTIANP